MGSAESIPVELRHRVFNLVNQAKHNTGNLRSEALREIWLLTENDEYKIPLCDPSLQFLTLITEILRTCLHEQITLKNSIACICNLSTCQQNKMIICSPTLGLLPALIHLIDESNGILVQDTSAKKWIYTTLSNCALHPDTHPYLLADTTTLKYLEVLKMEMERDTMYLPPVKSFGCISLSLQNQYAYLLIHLRVHEIIVNRLISYGPIPANWPDRNTGMAYWSLNFITSFSSLPEGRKSLRSLLKLDFFLQLLSCTEMEGIKASIITSNIVCGHEEDLLHCSLGHHSSLTIPPVATVPTTSILQMYPQIFPTLMDVYSATLDFDSNRPEVKSLLSRGFGYAIVKMRDISATLRNLSMNDENKAIMLSHPSLIPFVLKSIYLFIDNSSELSAIYHNYREYAGGGGQDLETISYLLELLLQLSFYYDDDYDTAMASEAKRKELQQAQRFIAHDPDEDEEDEYGESEDSDDDDEDDDNSNSPRRSAAILLKGVQSKEAGRHLLQEQFNRPEYHMTEMLQSFLSLPVDRKVPYDAKQYAQQLLNRLLPLEMTASSTEKKIPQHIFLFSSKSTPGFTAEVLGNDNKPSLRKGHNKALIISLQKRLIEMGYDVWRDEEGSSLLPSTFSAANPEEYEELLAKAIQYSYLVILCISPAFSIDHYSKLVAKYVKMRQQTHELKVIYVMLDKDYHPRSQSTTSFVTNPTSNTANTTNNNSSQTTINPPPDTNAQPTNTNNSNQATNPSQNTTIPSSSTQLRPIEGWLGLMIGSDIWYPLWESKYVESTAHAIAVMAANHARTQQNHQIIQYIVKKQTALSSNNQVDGEVNGVTEQLNHLQLLHDQQYYHEWKVFPIKLSKAVQTDKEDLDGSEVRVKEMDGLLANQAADSLAQLSEQANGNTGGHELRNQKQADFQAVWEILQNNLASKDTGALSRFLEELGLFSSEDLSYLTIPEFQSLLEFLKPIPQRKLAKLIKEIERTRAS